MELSKLESIELEFMLTIVLALATTNMHTWRRLDWLLIQMKNSGTWNTDQE